MKVTSVFSLFLAIALTVSLTGCGPSAHGSGPVDGTYQVEVMLEGGSGKAGVQSPAELTVQDGKMTVTLVWSSAHYDYMLLDGEKYTPVSLEPGSTFQLPVADLGTPFSVIADTTAMSTPHEIEYTLTVFAPGETDGTEETPKTTGDTSSVADWRQEIGQILTYDHSMELSYADGFSVDYYEGGCALLTIWGDSRSYLVISEGMDVPSGLPEEVILLRLPLAQIYLAASAVMDMFINLDAMDTLAFTGTREDGWYLEAARDAMARGELTYAGSYSTPDYERIRAAGCDLAIESTMIYHSPEVREQLERFGIPVLVDHSSYESSPLGRIEWIKVYGLLTGREAAAQAAFEKQEAAFAAISEQEATGKSVAFFYIPSGGGVNVRRSSDYIPKMIEMAGGSYLPENAGEDGLSSSSTTSMQMESFYASARDADFLIYNGTIEGPLSSLEDLISKDSMLTNFKAVQERNVFCTAQNLYQSSMELGSLIQDLHRMLSGDREGMTYLYLLE